MLDERFWSKVDKTPVPDWTPWCWRWTGRITHKGYGAFGRTNNAHRRVWEEVFGPIPPGMQIDHLCRVRSCVNPAHLDLVTPKENTMRGLTVGRAHSLTTHCPKGHAYDEANTRTYQGRRFCRTCDRKRCRWQGLSSEQRAVRVAANRRWRAKARSRDA